MFNSLTNPNNIPVVSFEFDTYKVISFLSAKFVSSFLIIMPIIISFSCFAALSRSLILT